MPDKDMPVGIEELKSAFDFFVSHNPELPDKELLEAFNYYIRAFIPHQKSNSPLPLIRVVPNGYFEMKRALKNDK